MFWHAMVCMETWLIEEEYFIGSHITES